MRFIVFIAALFTSLTAMGSAEQVVVRLNTQTYTFENQVRLSSILSLIADKGDWHWPSAAIFDLNDPTAENEQKAILAEIERIKNDAKLGTPDKEALNNLYAQVSAWTVATRLPVPVSYNRARLYFEDNPMFEYGHYWVRLNTRPNVVHFSGIIEKPGAYKHASNLSITSVVGVVSKSTDADRSFVYVISPQGKVSEKGIAYWNFDFSQVAPGSQIFIPASANLFDSRIQKLNERISALAVHRVLPQ